jgi:Protein of unknown function (DUF3152)
VGVTKRVQDRYRAGARRTSAQPLAASWQPAGEPRRERQRKRKPRPRGLRGVLTTYGWRIYAVPVLVAITVLVFIDTSGDEQTPAAGGEITGVRNEQAVPGGDPAPEDPEATEKPAVPPNLNIPTAELPNGAPFAQAGRGDFDVLPGSGRRLGRGGDLFTYSIEIERGIDLRPFGGADSFASLVDTTLADPRGWAATGQVSVQRVDSGNPDIRITLATPDTVHQPDFCGYSIRYESSCWRRSESRVMINLARWVRGAVAFGGDIGTYRQYAINHEIGHAFGNSHVGCGKTGDLAPVMMQQSFGVANNYVAQLNDQVGNADPVNADGKTCRYNAWPNPQAQPPA